VTEATLLDLKERFRVRKVWYNPYQMHATAQGLTRAGLKREKFPQTVPNLTEASQNLFELIKGYNLVAYPDSTIRLAVSRAISAITSAGMWRSNKVQDDAQIIHKPLGFRRRQPSWFACHIPNQLRWFACAMCAKIVRTTSAMY